MGYHAMLDRIDKMHLPPEKEDIWEVSRGMVMPTCNMCQLDYCHTVAYD
jgi:hypothetical protein